MSNQLTEDEIDAAKKRQELDAKSRSLVREVAWQIIFLAILLWVIVGNQDHNVFYQNTNLKDMFFSDIGRVSIILEDMSWWLAHVFCKINNRNEFTLAGTIIICINAMQF